MKLCEKCGEPLPPGRKKYCAECAEVIRKQQKLEAAYRSRERARAERQPSPQASWLTAEDYEGVEHPLDRLWIRIIEQAYLDRDYHWLLEVGVPVALTLAPDIDTRQWGMA